ncbi:Pet127-domain-containing protein, partial [Nadsonia fulvescens var. elongata DSM 6958]
EVPKLEHNLDRVLFNPGVHVLQDPRSNVYNFTPYLQQVMPVQEFDFDMVSQYITSSKDQALGSLAKEHRKKYIGSTSSMTGVLSQFHHLLSQNRLLNISELSKNFPGDTTTFTKWQRGPASVFLVKKPKLGIYAIDSDKSYDQEIVLSLLGKTLEQLLTTPEIEFENYRKKPVDDKDDKMSQTIDEPKDVYQYSKCGGFIMRSQLDCVDTRLPGSGVFDLKTRAVCAVRHDMYHVESNGGTNYQIKRLVGPFESYEREYYEMIRATLLKYSLQARIGNMDGIFVAYHNIRKLFGFQYISLEDMDKIIHGYNGKSPEDYKFRMSMKLWTIALDRFSQDHPDKSMRLIFHASTETEGVMDIYVAPMEEKDIVQLQDRG